MNLKKINWGSEYIVPKFLKEFLTEDIYKNRYLKSFTLVSMLRNFTTTDTNKKDSESIIIDKSLVIKPIETSNLVATFAKPYGDPESISRGMIESSIHEIYNIVIHINNKFNPTKIGLFDAKDHIYFYQLEGDSTLHVNIGLLTFFRILSAPAIKINRRKMKETKDAAFIPN